MVSVPIFSEDLLNVYLQTFAKMKVNNNTGFYRTLSKISPRVMPYSTIEWGHNF